ncbi:hypothetical protein Gotur_013478 [Gossypium turneri]
MYNKNCKLWKIIKYGDKLHVLIVSTNLREENLEYTNETRTEKEKIG